MRLRREFSLPHTRTGELCKRNIKDTETDCPSDGKHADSIAYPMHPICWRIFEQNYHTLATGTSPNLDNLASIFLAQPLETKRGIPLARGFRPNFSGDFDYGGAEDFWEEEEEGDSDFFDDSDSDEFEWMCRDPGHALGFETSVCWELPMIAMTKAAPPNLRSSSDTFSKLPLELLEMILSFLPTVSVRAIRMASRTFSSLVLTQAFGRSRFMFPHDLCHFSDFESSISLQDGAEIDWEDLCYMLWNTKSSNRGNMEWLENRRRISKITLPLAQILLEMDRESHEEEDHEEATAEKGT